MSTAVHGTHADTHYKALVEACAERYGRTESALIPILQEIQNTYRFLPQPALQAVARELDIPPATVCGVATFYTQFSLEPKGKHVIRVCDGTACHVRDNREIIDAIRTRLSLTGKQRTTADGRYTLEIVNCIGACALAPAVVLDDKVHGQMTGDSINALLDDVDAADAAEEAPA